jgi:hypothetical protein
MELVHEPAQLGRPRRGYLEVLILDETVMSVESLRRTATNTLSMTEIRTESDILFAMAVSLRAGAPTVRLEMEAIIEW